MRRLLRALLALAFVALGVVFAALNDQPLRLDLYFFEIAGSSGLLLPAAVLLGALLGGLSIAAAVIWPLKRRLSRAQRAAQAAPATVDSGAAAQREAGGTRSP